MAEIIQMPKLGFDMAEGTLVRWVKAEGDPVARGDVLAEIETDKATVEVESQAAGVMHKHLVSEGTSVPIGQAIAVVGEQGEQIDLASLTGGAKAVEQAGDDKEPVAEAAVSRAAEKREAEAPPDDGQPPEGVRASPLARRVARELGVDLNTLRGSGPQGRIVRKDVDTAGQPVAEAPRAAGQPAETTRVPLSRLRAAIGRRMTAAKQNLPHFYLTADLQADRLMELRAELNAVLPEEEGLSVNDFIVKAAARAMRAFPNLNASLEDGHIVRHGEINIGIAVAVDDGLLTVVVRDADLKPLSSIRREAREMVARAREGRVRPEEIEGSTFTISNLGMFDVDHFIAIINPPEAAILAIGSVRQEAVVIDGQLAAGQRLKVTLSADHRLTDGAEAARWLQVFREYIEQPLRLLLEA
jgi:pyruvate dehydrogenase E2 component (dihydrolipoamide acetyltransferase)